MVTNPWDDNDTSTPAVPTDAGLADAVAVQRMGQGVDPGETIRQAEGNAASLVAEVQAGRMDRAAAERYLAQASPTLTPAVISQIMDREMVAQDNNPFDGYGNDPNANRSMMATGGQTGMGVLASFTGLDRTDDTSARQVGGRLAPSVLAVRDFGSGVDGNQLDMALAEGNTMIASLPTLGQGRSGPSQSA